MAQDKIAIFTSKKINPFIIGQTFLRWYINKLFPIKLLDAIWKRKPAKIVAVEIDINHGTLKQAFIYRILESIATLYSLPINHNIQPGYDKHQEKTGDMLRKLQCNIYGKIPPVLVYQITQ
ncbi:MAG: hypothetical protein ABI402_17865 [Ferruginibacter sp.]